MRALLGFLGLSDASANVTAQAMGDIWVDRVSEEAGG